MENILIALFDSEKEAFAASKKLEELNEHADISLSESVIITKSAGGKVSYKDAKGETIPFTVTGLIAGSLMGIIGGPIGILVGAYFGTLTGLLSDAVNLEEKSDYLDDLTATIPAGKTALIAHVDESWNVPVDTVFEELGVEVKRIGMDEEVDKWLDEQSDELNNSIHKIEQKVETAVGDSKEALQQQLDELKAKQKAFKKAVDHKVKKQRKDYNTWLGHLKSKLHHLTENAKEEMNEKRREHLEKRIAEQEEKLEKLNKKD